MRQVTCIDKVLMEDIRSYVMEGDVVIVMRAYRKGESCPIEGCEGFVRIKSGENSEDSERHLDRISHAVLREILEGKGV